MKKRMIYKISWMLLLLPLFAGCNDTDDVVGIFTGKTWKLNYITVDGGHEMFNFWENKDQENQSINELKKNGSYHVTFTASLIEGHTVKGKIEGNLINGGSLTGSWNANGKNNNFQATVTGNYKINGNKEIDFLAEKFLEGLNSATSYEGDSNNLFILYKPESSNRTFRIAFRVVK